MRTRLFLLSSLVSLSWALCAGAAQATEVTGAAEAPPPAASGARPAGPPPEAIVACEGRAEGAAASFTGRHGRTVSGTCQYGPGTSKVLAVRPDRMPAPPSR